MSTISEPMKRIKSASEKPSRAKSPKKTARRTKPKEYAVPSIDLLSIAIRRRALIALSCFLGLLTGSAYYLLATPKYESRAEIMLLHNDSTALASPVNGGKEGISQDLLATHMNLIQSHRIVNEALESNQLKNLPSIAEKVTETVTPVDYVCENLYVTRGGKGAARNAHTLSIAFRHTDRNDCEAMVSAIVSEYQNFVTTKFKDINEEAVKLINTARIELDGEIEELNARYRDFRNSAPLISTNNRNIHEMRYQDIATEMSQLTISLDETKGRMRLVLDGLKRLDESAHPLEKLSLIDERSAARLGILVSVERGQAQTAAFQALQPERTAGVTTEYSKLLELKTRLTNAKVNYGSRHPQVQELETQIEEIQKFLNQRKADLGISDEEKSLTADDVMNAYLRLLKEDISVMEQRLQDLDRQRQEAERDAKDLVRYELENDDLIRRRERQESLYDTVVSRLKDINMRQDSTSIIQEVIQEPTFGERVSPSGLIAAVIATLAATFFAGFSVFVAEFTDKQIHTVEELEELYGANVIGQIVDFSRDSGTKSLMKRLRVERSSLSPELIAFHDAKNTISEAIRTVRTQTLFNLGPGGQILAISSPQQGDGKSTITSNLAISLACSNKKVLLIDCDLRRPNIHKLFGLSDQHGLTDVCLNQLDLNDCLKSTLIENLTIMTSGGIPDNPSELLSSARFSELLQSCRSQYDIVVLDCPPLLPVADPSIIAPLADGLLLVTKTDAESLVKSQECHRIISRLDCKLIGIVINCTKLLGPGYYSRYQAYYQQTS